MVCAIIYKSQTDDNKTKYLSPIHHVACQEVIEASGF